jgi:flagellar assembly factor FliW
MSELRTVTFDAGLPGFPGALQFTLAPWGPEGTAFSLLECVEEPDLRFVVVPPELFFPEYGPEIDDDTAATLEITDPSDALILVIVTLADPAERSTANLLGPLVINVKTSRGVQAVLHASDYEVRHLLVA